MVCQLPDRRGGGALLVGSALLVAGWAFLFLAPQLGSWAQATEAGGQLLIVTAPDFEEYANSLAAWRRQKGISTVVKTTSETGATATNIRDYIVSAYNAWTTAPQYILLLGDAAYIPPHYVRLSPYDGRYNASDLYYAIVDQVGSLTSLTGTKLLPDLSVGRFCANSAAEAEIMVNKAINYERSPVDDDSFYTAAAVAARFYGNGPYDSRPFLKTSEDIRDHWLTQGYSIERIYYASNPANSLYWNNGAYGDGSSLPSELLYANGFAWAGNTASITNAVNTGVFWLNFRGLSGTTSWSLPTFSRDNVDALNNGSKLPFVSGFTAYDGFFDTETDELSSNDSYSSLAEHWQRQAAGAIGVAAHTRNTWSGHTDYENKGFVDAFWPDFISSYSSSFQGYLLGPALSHAKHYYASIYPDYSIRTAQLEMLTLFGDPTTELWTGVPQSLSSAWVPSRTLTSRSTLYVQTGVSGAMAAATQGTSLLGTGTANANGIALVTLDTAPSAGTMTVTLSSHNYTPSENTVTVNTTPFISSVSATPAATSAAFTWTTTETLSSQLEYGLDTNYGSTTTEADTTPRVTSHIHTLPSLPQCTTFHARVLSKDQAGNTATGEDQVLTTSCLGSASVAKAALDTVTTAAGGTVANLDDDSKGLTLTIPVGYTAADAQIQTKRLETATVLETAPAPAGKTIIGNHLYDLKALTDPQTAISAFDTAVTVTISYAASDISSTMVESTLAIYRWDGSSWNQLTGCTLDTSAKTISCPTTQFSVFGLFGEIDTTNPTAVSLQSPSHNAYLREANPTFIWQITSDPGNSTGISYYQLYIDGNQIAGNFTSSPDSNLITYTLGDHALPNGASSLSEMTHSWYVKVFDKAGNSTDSSTSSFKIDRTPPTGTISINQGEEATTSLGVTLSLSAADPLPNPNTFNLGSDYPSGVKFYRLANSSEFNDTDSPWREWHPTDSGALTVGWDLSPGEGSKTVFVQYQDQATNISSPFSTTTGYSPPQEEVVPAAPTPSSSVTFLPPSGYDQVEATPPQETDSTSAAPSPSPAASSAAGSPSEKEDLALFPTPPLEVTPGEVEKLPADQTTPSAQEGYLVQIKVLNPQGQPLPKAKVTLASTPRTAYTNEAGLASFLNVESGEHTVTIAYRSQEGTQKIIVGQDAHIQEYRYTFTINPAPLTAFWPHFLMGAGLVLVLAFLARRLVRRSPVDPYRESV